MSEFRLMAVDADPHGPDGMLGLPVHCPGFLQNKPRTGISPIEDTPMPKSVEFGKQDGELKERM